MASALNKVKGGINNPVKLALAEKLRANRSHLIFKNNDSSIDVSYYDVNGLPVKMRAEKSDRLYRWFSRLLDYKAKPTKFTLNFEKVV